MADISPTMQHSGKHICENVNARLAIAETQDEVFYHKSIWWWCWAIMPLGLTAAPNKRTTYHLSESYCHHHKSISFIRSSKLSGCCQLLCIQLTLNKQEKTRNSPWILWVPRNLQALSARWSSECWCVLSNQEVWPLYVAPISGQGAASETWWVHQITIRCREGTKQKEESATFPKDYLPNSTSLPTEEFHTSLTDCDIPAKMLEN